MVHLLGMPMILFDRHHGQRGSAIVYVLFAAGMLGAVAMHVMQLSKNLDTNYRVDKKHLVYNDFVSHMRTMFENPLYCTQLLSGKDIDDSFTATEANLLPFSGKYGNSSVNFVNGWRSPEGLVLDKIVVESEATPVRSNVRRDIPSSPNLTASNAVIKIYAKEGTPSLSIAKFDHLKIEIMLYYSLVAGVKTLYSCFGRYGDGALCTLSGGTYNVGVVGANRASCEPDLNCFISKQGIITDPALCLAPYQAIQIAANMYQCQWCNQN